MDTLRARQVLQSWSSAPIVELAEALDVLAPPSWIQDNPGLTADPRDSVDERTLFGVHQRWDCNLMPYREFHFRGRYIYLFECSVLPLLQISQ